MMQRFVKFKSKKKGFTLVELIVVIAIIAILAAILLPRFFGFTDDARKSAAIAEAKSIRSLTETFYSSHGDYPIVDDDENFKVQTGVDPDSGGATYDNSPTFSGKINISADAEIDNGAFEYTKAEWTAKCDASGNIEADGP